MSVKNSGALLSKAITAALHNPSGNSITAANWPTGVRTLASAGLAVAIMQTPTAGAVTLGELKLHSALGEPLRGTTTATIASGESLRGGCISTSNYRLGTLQLRDPVTINTPATNVPGEYTITLETARPLHEPMYEVQLQVNCPGTAMLTRSYIVMLDVPSASVAPPVVQPATAAPNTDDDVPVLTRTAEPKSTVRIATPPASTAPKTRGDNSINPGQVYLVTSGDTLFGIAARLNDRPAGTTWQVVDLLFRENPGAFIAGKRERLKAGVKLNIPAADVIAKLRPGVKLDPSPAPTAPEPERNLNARPALLRNEQADAIKAEQDEPNISGNAAADNATATPAVASTEPPAVSDTTIESDAVTETAEPLAKTSTAAEAAAIAAATRANNSELRAARDKTTATKPARNNAAGQERVSFPTAEPVNPLLAGLIGMFLGALLATLILNGRRILEKLSVPEAHEDVSDTDFVDANAATDKFEQNELTPAGTTHDFSTGGSSETVFSDSQVRVTETVGSDPVKQSFADFTDTDEFTNSQPSTIEVEFSELDAMERRTLGFDQDDVPGNTAEQPKLGESPRINLEGLGTSFDLQSELQEMLQDFSDSEEAEHVADADATDEFELNNADLAELEDLDDVEDLEDLEDTREVEHPDLSTNTGMETLRDLQSIGDSNDDILADELAEDELADDELADDELADDEILDDETTEDFQSKTFTTQTLSMKPFSLGLDLDLGLGADDDQPQDLDLGLDADDELPDDLDLSFDTEIEASSEDEQKDD